MNDIEKFFLSKLKDGTLVLNDRGIIKNTKTNRILGGRNLSVSMKNLDTDKILSMQIARLQWLKNYGDIPKGMKIAYKDGNKENCELSNLHLATTAEIVKNAHLNKSEKWDKGEHHPQSKLNEDAVKKARELYFSGKPTKHLLEKYQVSKVTLHLAIQGKTWKKAPGPTNWDYNKYPQTTESIKKLVSRGETSASIVKILVKKGTKMPRRQIIDLVQLTKG